MHIYFYQKKEFLCTIEKQCYLRWTKKIWMKKYHFILGWNKFENINLPKKNLYELQLTLIISNSMGQWKKFESTVVRLKRSYENTRSVVCLTTKGRQLEQNFFEGLKPASHCLESQNDLKLIRCFCFVFFFSVKFFESCGMTDNC